LQLVNISKFLREFTNHKIMNFVNIALSRQDEYNNFFCQCTQKASDYSLANIWGWAEEYGIKWSFAYDLVWLKQTRPEEVFWAPVGDWDLDWRKIYSRIKKPIRFIRVPEKLKQIWLEQLPGIMVQESRDHWDYLYLVQELIELKGNKFHKKKNLLNQFVKKYDFTYVELEQTYIEHALALQTEWCLWKECFNSPALDAENKVIIRIFHDFDKIKGLFGAGLLVDQKMIAYTVAEELEPDTLVIHFEKGCPNYKGVYQAINQLFLKNSASGYKYVNREQDLGELGLRKAKESYHPVGYLKKYEVIWK